MLENLAPFEKFRCVLEEEARLGGSSMKKGRRRVSAKHIAQIILFLSNLLHNNKFYSGATWGKKGTIIPAPLKSPPRSSRTSLQPGLPNLKVFLYQHPGSAGSAGCQVCRTVEHFCTMEIPGSTTVRFTTELSSRGLGLAGGGSWR